MVKFRNFKFQYLLFSSFTSKTRIAYQQIEILQLYLQLRLFLKLKTLWNIFISEEGQPVHPTKQGSKASRGDEQNKNSQKEEAQRGQSQWLCQRQDERFTESYCQWAHWAGIHRGHHHYTSKTYLYRGVGVITLAVLDCWKLSVLCQKYQIQWSLS